MQPIPAGEITTCRARVCCGKVYSRITAPTAETGRVPIWQVGPEFLVRVSQVAVLASVMDSSSGASGLLLVCLLIG
jgi:hypothetical protein